MSEHPQGLDMQARSLARRSLVGRPAGSLARRRA